MRQERVDGKLDKLVDVVDKRTKYVLVERAKSEHLLVTLVSLSGRLINSKLLVITLPNTNGRPGSHSRPVEEGERTLKGIHNVYV